MIDAAFLEQIGLDPEQIRQVLAAREAEKQLRAAAVGVGIPPQIAERIADYVSMKDVPVGDPELLRILVSEEFRDLAVLK